MNAPSTQDTACETPRPMRADARRNHQRIVECAREAFAEHGPDAPLDDIARRAGVGPGTLYRHFPHRDALIEAVYRSSIENLAARAFELMETHPPVEALELWFRAQVDYVMDKQSLAMTLKAAIDRGSEAFTLCSKLITEAATTMLRNAQATGLIRPELEPRDLLRLGHGIGVACDNAPEAADRLIAVTLAGLRTPG
ncbi:transcriptional regulator, TetR family [Nocardia nova SH22a]|uniref:Transcriptional regulator, TetR family n=1 Tax=Nocardia nova SH22a TaxID=1415166 RepID=W5TA73_9NOCA|nr:TetR/AcrR family transcriptional regulator [Nocardia nova]AHH16034.1 transcriptional regulator, TetR family [Nocardia nova SH22a]